MTFPCGSLGISINQTMPIAFLNSSFKKEWLNVAIMTSWFGNSLLIFQSFKMIKPVKKKKVHDTKTDITWNVKIYLSNFLIFFWLRVFLWYFLSSMIHLFYTKDCRIYPDLKAYRGKRLIIFDKICSCQNLIFQYKYSPQELKAKIQISVSCDISNHWRENLEMIVNNKKVVISLI